MSIKFFNKLLNFFGWSKCANCNKFARIKKSVEWVLTPNETPLFYYWECPKCKYLSDLIKTDILIEAMASYGHKNIKEDTLTLYMEMLKKLNNDKYQTFINYLKHK